MSYPLVVSIVLVALGGGLLAFGIRGRRGGDEPRCRGCGFEVTGIAGLEDRTARCPECGAELNTRRSVVKGVRRRRPLIGAAGAVLLLGGATGTFLAAAAIDLNPYKPTWWLARFDARRTAGAEFDAAMAELSTRIATGRASKRSVRPAIAAVLERQGDRTVAWSPALGEVFEAAWARGWVGEAERLRYLKQSIQPEVWMVDPHAKGEVQVGIEVARDRIGPAMNPAMDTPLILQLVGGELLLPMHESSLETDVSTGLMLVGVDAHHSGVSSGDWTFRTDAAAGTYPIRTRWRLRLDTGITLEDRTTDPANGYSIVYQLDRPPRRTEGATVLEWEAALYATATVLAGDLVTFELVDDPTFAPRVRAAMTNSWLNLRRLRDGSLHLNMSFDIDLNALPASLDHYFVVRQGEREWDDRKSQRVHAAAADPRASFRSSRNTHLSMMLPGADPSRPLELLLRPDPAAATWASRYHATGKPAPVVGGDVLIADGLRVRDGAPGANRTD